jgi:hypothetical protein
MELQRVCCHNNNDFYIEFDGQDCIAEREVKGVSK